MGELVCVKESQDRLALQLLAEALRSAGIEAAITGNDLPQIYGMPGAIGPLRLVVEPARADEAAQLVAALEKRDAGARDEPPRLSPRRLGAVVIFAMFCPGLACVYTRQYVLTVMLWTAAATATVWAGVGGPIAGFLVGLPTDMALGLWGVRRSNEDRVASTPLQLGLGAVVWALVWLAARAIHL